MLPGLLPLRPRSSRGHGVLESGLGQVVLAETNNVSSKRDLQEKEPPLKLGLGQVELAETNNAFSKRDLQENDQLSKLSNW